MTRWKVGLSNGETFIEDHGPFARLAGKLSPWHKLKEYLAEKELKISSLCLTEGSRTINLPSMTDSPRFSFFANSAKPIAFEFGRAYGMDDNGANKDVFEVIEANYGDRFLQVWVDSKNSNNSWVLVSSKSIIDK